MIIKRRSKQIALCVHSGRASSLITGIQEGWKRWPWVVETATDDGFHKEVTQTSAGSSVGTAGSALKQRDGFGDPTVLHFCSPWVSWMHYMWENLWLLHLNSRKQIPQLFKGKNEISKSSTGTWDPMIWNHPSIFIFHLLQKFSPNCTVADKERWKSSR